MIVMVTRKAHLRPNRFAQGSEGQGAERTHGKPRRKCQKRKEQPPRLADVRKEVLCNDAGERAEYIKIIPLKHRADRRGGDDKADVFLLRRTVHDVSFDDQMTLNPCVPSRANCSTRPNSQSR